MLNRSIPPSLFAPKLPAITLGEEITAKPRILFVPSNEDICRIDLVFHAGLLNQMNKGVFACIKALLFSGTKNKSEEQILNSLDGLGAYYGSEYDYNRFTVSLYSMASLIHKALPVFLDAVFNASFPEEKISTFKIKAVAEYDQNQEKTGYLARVLCNQHFFTTKTLRKPANKNEIHSISQKAIVSEYENIKRAGFTLFICGNIGHTEWLFEDIKPYFDSPVDLTESKPLFSQAAPGHYHHHKNESVQTSLRAQVQSIGKHHPDYSHTLLANMLLGGYFGSMLMQNIREVKGLTYGIHTSLKSHGDYSILNLSTDIKSGSIDEVITAVGNEFQHLCSGKFTIEMLEKTKSYTLGVLAKSCDELFSDLEKTKSIILEDLSHQYYENLFEQVENASKEDIMRVANKHLKINNLCYATCGTEQYWATKAVK